MTSKEFIHRAKQTHGDKYDYSKIEYVNALTKVCIICPVHGDFWQRPSHHLAGHGCSKCASIFNAAKLRVWTEELCREEALRYTEMKAFRTNSKEAYNAALKHRWLENYTWLTYKIDMSTPKKNRQKYSQEDIIQRLRSMFGNRYSYEHVVYKKMKTPITLVCHEKDANGVEHGAFSIRPDNIFSSKQGCPKCCDSNRSKLQRKSLEMFINEAIRVHGSLYEYHKVEYINTRTNVCIVCPIHGDFWQTPSNHLKGQGCPHCSGNAKKWDRETCEQEARKYNYMFDFRVKSSGAYNKACENGWLDDYIWLKKLPPKATDYEKNTKYIYSYEFIDKNAVYVGLTNSIIKRDWQHRNSLNSSVYRFAQECNSIIPNIKKLETGVPTTESGKREKYWVDFYKKQGWHLLNRAKTGERESAIGIYYPIKWTKKVVKEKAQECDYDIKLFMAQYPGAYGAILSRYRGLLNELFPNRMIRRHHTIEEAIMVVQKGHFTKRMQLHKACYWAYRILHRHGRLDEFFPLPKEYTREEALEDANNYSSIEQIRVKNYRLYNYLKKNDLFKITKPTDRMFRRVKTIEEAWEISQYYPTKTELRNHASIVYRVLKEHGLLDKRYQNSKEHEEK